jgi:hypothetical protein
MATISLPVESLLVDPRNPRHETVTGQSAAIKAIVDEQGIKLVNLARDIAERGLNPLDRVLVVKSGKSYTVLEGNRRVVALKLLKNPKLADGTPIAAEIKKIAASSHKAPGAIECEVATSREAAKHWLILRHQGEQDGRGVVPWNPLTSIRFNARPGSREARWVSFIDAVAAAFPSNETIQSAIQTIGAGRITTLGRLYSDPDFRQFLGLEDDGAEIRTHYPAAALEAALERVFSDLAGDLSVTKIKSKDQRTKYIAGLPKPAVKSYQKAAHPLGAPRTTAAKLVRSTVQRQPRRVSPFKDLNLQKLHPRLDDIVRELRRLDVEKFPNAGAVLSRVLLELSLDEFIAKRGISFPKGKPKLKDKLKRCLHEVDPSDKDAAYQGVRAGLNDGSSIYAIATLHGYVHNKDFHPTPADVRGIVLNLKPFLQKLNDTV